MKRISLILVLAVSFTAMFAQIANVKKAKNYALMESADFKAAREAIKPALTDSTTKNLAETWYVAGLIGSKENEKWYKQEVLGQTFDKDVKGQAILESIPYFLKALTLDSVPDKKGKIKTKFSKEIKDIIKDYYITPQNLYEYAAYLFDTKKDYAAAHKVFDVYLSIPKMPFIKNEIKIDTNYVKIQYYSAAAASQADMNDDAIKIYEDIKDKGFEEKVIYQLLYQEYFTKKDTVNYVRVLNGGYTKFPNEPWFLQNLINYYIFSGQVPEAMKYLNAAIDRDPKNAEYQLIKGKLSDQIGNAVDARAAFDKAIELNPKLAEGYSEVGRLLYNKAVAMFDDANNIKDIKLYNAAKKKAEVALGEAIPFYKKASELDPNEIEYKKNLKTIYYRLGMDKEFNAIDKEINAM